MKLIIGLGNPGNDYAQTRHNFGFYFLDFFAKTYGAQWNFAKKFNAEIFETTIAGEKIIFAKPQTFYNEVGQSARAFRDFYKLDDSDILVIHDEMDLPFGTMRTRTGGESAGNNGIKSLIAHLGRGFSRIRVGSGIVRENDPNTKPEKTQQINHVLGKISRDEAKTLEPEAPKIREIVENFAKNEFEQSTYKF